MGFPLEEKGRVRSVLPFFFSQLLMNKEGFQD